MLAELLDKANAYLLGVLSLRDLEDWLVSHLQETLESGDSTAIDIANHLDADLVQLDEDIINESILRQRLQQYTATSAPIIYSDAPLSTNVLTMVTATPLTQNQYTFEVAVT